jgi:glycosyltransferase involved in cell wall biosynthesis
MTITKDERIGVSAIILTYNNEKTIRRCMESILANNPNETVVVDGGSLDKTLEIIKRLGDARIVRDMKGIAKAREVGWRTAMNDLILFVDADAYIEPDTIERLKRQLEDDVASVSCSVACANPESLVARMRNLDFELGYAEQFENKTVVDCLNEPTMCGIFRRKALLDVNGFDTEFPYAEDVRLLMKFRKRRYRALLLRAPRVYHYHRTSLRGVFVQVYQHGFGRGMLTAESHTEYYTINRLIRFAKNFLRTVPRMERKLFAPYIVYRGITGIAAIFGYLRGKGEI